MFQFITKLFKKKIHSLDGINLEQPVKLCFTKDEYGEYIVSFLNPIYNKWWTLPCGNAGIHARWSLLNHGSHGAYSLYRLTCQYDQIEYTKNRFSTLDKVQQYLKLFEADYIKFTERQQIKANLPNQIIT